MDLTRKSGKKVKDLISEYNKKAIDLLTRQEFTQSFNLLKNAENLLKIKSNIIFEAKNSLN